MFLASSDFKDLAKYRLSAAEWDALKVFEKILSVRESVPYQDTSNYVIDSTCFSTDPVSREDSHLVQHHPRI